VIIDGQIFNLCLNILYDEQYQYGIRARICLPFDMIKASGSKQAKFGTAINYDYSHILSVGYCCKLGIA
jgi:hypothetical protein